MERTRIYAALATTLIKRGFDPAIVEKYGKLWDSITPVDRLPCPLCFAYADKRSALKPLALEAGNQPFRCEGCIATFYSPLPA